ncbi:MAG: hypothetical protein VX498_03115, partial [Myxococcota bacterium]|nr:hypothetical protein [Myxococcota bacterium]
MPANAMGRRATVMIPPPVKPKKEAGGDESGTQFEAAMRGAGAEEARSARSSEESSHEPKGESARPVTQVENDSTAQVESPRKGENETNPVLTAEGVVQLLNPDFLEGELAETGLVRVQPEAPTEGVDLPVPQLVQELPDIAAKAVPSPQTVQGVMEGSAPQVTRAFLAPTVPVVAPTPLGDASPLFTSGQAMGDALEMGRQIEAISPRLEHRGGDGNPQDARSGTQSGSNLQLEGNSTAVRPETTSSEEPHRSLLKQKTGAPEVLARPAHAQSGRGNAGPAPTPTPTPRPTKS